MNESKVFLVPMSRPRFVPVAKSDEREVRSARQIAVARADSLRDAEQSGPRPRLQCADTIHWRHGDMLYHGKIITMGRRGVRAVTKDGREWTLRHEDIGGLGIHPSTRRQEAPTA